MTPRRRDAFRLLVLLASLTACTRSDAPPDIPFASSYESKIDLARLEHDLPLTPSDLMKITPENLKFATQEQVDQMYARLTAGSIPDGTYEGRLFVPKGGPAHPVRISVTLNAGRTMNLETIGKVLWTEKVLDRTRRTARSRLHDKAALASLVGTGHMLDLDRTEAPLLFPAKLYCGQSLLDGRRESIVIDHVFNDDLEGYREQPDAEVGRDGLELREEIRMIRPGFYLGRAYIKRVFLLNFILFNRITAEREAESFQKSGGTDEDCWIGSQRLRVATR
jgi:hypothetical protein